jgi:hypothetical protein
LPVVDLFRYPTIATLARAMRVEAPGGMAEQMRRRAEKQRAAIGRNQPIAVTEVRTSEHDRNRTR